MALQNIKFAPWAAPEAEVRLCITPRLHKDGYFVGVNIRQARDDVTKETIARIMDTLQRTSDRNFRAMVYGDFTS